MNVITEPLKQCWNMLFSVTEPHLGISYGAIYLGIFVVGISLRVLMPLLGIAGGTAKSISRVSKSGKGLKQDERNKSVRYSYHSGQTVGSDRGDNYTYKYKVRK